MAPIVIVGATGGIGRSLASHLAKQGKRVHLIGRNREELTSITQSINQSFNQSTNQSIKQATDQFNGQIATMSVGDVMDAKSIEAAIQEGAQSTKQSTNPSTNQSTNPKSKFGELAGFAYCVGSIDLKPFSSLKSSSDMMTSLHVNLFGAVDALRVAYQPLMNYSINRPIDPSINQYPTTSSVLLFSSIAARQGFTNHSIVAVSKGAIESLTLSLAAEWSPNIRVNAIAPTLTQSKMSAKYFMRKGGSQATDQPISHHGNPLLDAVIATHPLRRLGVPEDISPLASLLLSPEAGMITGQILHVDAGKSTLNPKPDAKSR